MSAGIQARLRLAHAGAPDPALDVDLQLPGRGISAIFGPSGAGKTTLLRCIAGLERPRGLLRVQGETWQDDSRFLPTWRRPLGYVFQEASLLPHLSARDNLLYAQRRARRDATSWQRIVALLDLQALLDRRPEQLSGGERQRVAIGRALLIRPRLLLMDEPLTGLDQARRGEILPYLEQLHATLEIPVLYVSHSLDEVSRLADHLVILARGRVCQQGAALSLLPELQVPAGEEAGVVIPGRVAERDERWQLARVGFSGGALWVADTGDALERPVRIRVLARDVSLSRDAQANSSILNRLAARVIAIEDMPSGPQALVRLGIGATPLLARITRRSVAELKLQPGQTVWAQIKSVAVVR